MTHFIKLALAVIGASILLVSCAGSSGSNSLDERLLGDWLITSISTQNPAHGPENCQPDGATIPLGDTDIGCNADDWFTFRADGTWTNHIISPSSGTWKTDGNTLTLSYGSTHESRTYAASSTTFSFSQVIEGTTHINTLTKQ